MSEGQLGGMALADPDVFAGGLLADLFDRLDDAIVLSRSDEVTGEWCPQVIHVNRSFTELTGFSRAEAVGSLPSRWARGDDNPGAAKRIRDSLAAGECARLELTVRRPDGATRRIEAVIGHIGRDVEGRHYFIEVSRDITERQRDEELLRVVHDVAQIGSWEWDVDTDEVRWSDELHRIFGVDPGAFDATFGAYLSHVHPEDRELALNNVRRTLETARPFATDYRIVRPDGEVRWLHSRGRVTESADGHRRMVGACHDVTEQRELEAALSHQALHDPLTGLPNRALLDDRIQLALGRCARHSTGVAVVFIDLDRFKSVNDTHGHAVGDRVLTAVASRLRQVVRPSDTVARYGGDEFVAICDDIDTVAPALVLAERMSAAVAVPIVVDENTSVLVTASIGIAVGGATTTAERLFGAADAAMYAAKATGPGAVEVAAGD